MKNVVGQEFIAKVNYPLEITTNEEVTTDINCGEKCIIINQINEGVTILNLSLDEENAWVKVSYEDLKILS